MLTLYPPTPGSEKHLVDSAYYEIIIIRIILDINAFLLTFIKKTILYQSSILTVKKDDSQNLYKLYMVLMAVKVMCLCLAQDRLSDSILSTVVDSNY